MIGFGISAEPVVYLYKQRVFCLLSTNSAVIANEVKQSRVIGKVRD